MAHQVRRCESVASGFFRNVQLLRVYMYMIKNKLDTNEELFQIEMANDPNFLATRVSYKLGLNGPSITI